MNPDLRSSTRRMPLTRHATTLVAALLLAGFAPRIYAQANRIAVVDLQRAISATEDGRRAKARLERLMKRHQRSLDSEQAKLKQLKQQFDSATSDAEKQRLASEITQAYTKLQSQYMESQQELAKAESSATGQIVARMERILRRLGQADGYTLIVERNHGGVVWAPSNIDLTDQVIERYNAGEGRDGEPAAPSKRSGRRRRSSSD